MSTTSDICPAEYEAQRLQALDEYQILDTPEEPTFDHVTQIASIICEAPIALISLVDRDRQWFKSKRGLGVNETSLGVSFCKHALLQPGLLIVPDATKDPRFANNPLVTGEPYLRFYAGAQLESPQGYPLGTLCVLDYKPRELDETQRFALQTLANQVMANLELKLAHRKQAELITKLEAAQHDLAKQASTDPLTNLLNRRGFEQRLYQELALIKRGATAAALLLIDFDRFKEINDTNGHMVGDKVLTRFSELCQEMFRDADVLCRWGGDEFLVMLPGASAEHAQQAARRLHESLAITPMANETSVAPIFLSVSIGICSLTASTNLDAFAREIDALLYRAKAQGRNQTVYSSLMDDTGK